MHFIIVFLSLTVGVLSAYADEKVASKTNFTTAINQYLEAHPVCIGIPTAQHNPTASFNSLSNVLVLKGVVTARSWLTEGTLQWSWDPCPLPPQVIELSVVKLRSENYFLLQKLFP